MYCKGQNEKKKTTIKPCEKRGQSLTHHVSLAAGAFFAASAAAFSASISATMASISASSSCLSPSFVITATSMFFPPLSTTYVLIKT
ncbi:hypothetical protein Hanom_Chr09g00818991 [Helianthus anomalus]